MDHFPIILFLFWLVENLGLNTFVVSWAVWMCPLTLAWQPSLWINSSVPFWHSERFKNDPKWPPSVRQHVEGTERYKFNEFWPHGTEKGWILAFYCTITAMIKITIVGQNDDPTSWSPNDLRGFVLFRRSHSEAFSSLHWRWIKFWPIGHSATLAFSL